MPTEFYYASDVTPHDIPAGADDFGNTGGANKNASCKPGGGRAGPMTHDDATTMIVGNSNETGIEQAINMDWPGPIASLDVATTFSAYFRHRWGAGSAKAKSRYHYFCNAAGTAGGTFGGVTNSSTTWTNTGQAGPIDAATYRPGGGSWEIADFEDDMTLFGRPRMWNAATGWSHGDVTSIWGQMAFVPPAGGFVFMLNLAGLSALPFVGRLTDLTQFRKFMEWRRVFHPRHTIWTRDGEEAAAWADVRAYRWPTYLEMA
jgi:hypothetical protein